jgi:8-oxo-dGTP diphosphatase
MALTHDPPPHDAPRDAVVAIIRDRGRLLFVQRSHAARAAPGYWTPVSGAVEPGESEAEAVAREVREEVDLTVEADARVASLPTHDGRYVLHFWTCRIVAGDARVTSDEVADLRWCTPEELGALAPVFAEDVRIALAATSADAEGVESRDGSH